MFVMEGTRSKLSHNFLTSIRDYIIFCLFYSIALESILVSCDIVYVKAYYHQDGKRMTKQ